jgi:EthD domain
VTTPGKLAYLAQRNPALSREQFIRRWRQHGALAMGLARWDSVGRYAQCDCLPAPAGLGRASEQYDGVGVVWFTDTKPGSDSDRERMRADERQTFSTYVDEIALILRERAGMARDGGAVKANHFLTSRRDLTRDEFLALWLQNGIEHGPRASLVARYVGNEVVVNGRPGSLLPYHAYDEYWFESSASLSEYFSGHDSNPLDRPWIDQERSVLVVTNELILYDFL